MKNTSFIMLMAKAVGLSAVLLTGLCTVRAQAQTWNTNGNSGPGQVLGTTTADSFNLITNDTSRMVLHADGHIGIGTPYTEQGYILSVNGNVRAREVVVNTSTWSDFVFGKDYKLPSLDSLEKEIKAQKHLPGVPDAATVQKDGVPVGEMDKILLQKIEELTLYMIQQQKEIDALKQQLNNQ